MACSLSRIAFRACLIPIIAGFWLSPSLAQKVDAVAVCKADKTDAGIAACTAVLKGRGDRKSKASALLSRAQSYWALKRLVEAEKDYSETIKLVPNFAALYRDRGQIRFGLGNGAGAMEDFTVAIDKEPFNADNHANRGYLKMLGYDFEGAREDLRQGLFWQKDHPRSHYMMGLLHYSTARYREAVAAIEQARALGFKGNEGFVTKARSLFYIGAFDAAEKEASDGLQGFPAQYDLTEIRARARLVQRMIPEALADAEAVVLANPKYGRAYATRAAVKLAMKGLDEARADADKAIELDPKLFDAYEVKAEILLAAGDKAAARALYQQSAARTDAKMGYDVTSRNRASARIIELDKPPPIIVADLDETELKARCETRDDPLRMQSCDRLVETASTPQAKADMLILRSRARPYGQQIADLDLAVATVPDYLEAALARASGHISSYGYDGNIAPFERAWADADSVVRRAAPASQELRRALTVRGLVATSLGRHEEALADWSKLLQIEPDNAVWLQSYRATSLLMLGRPSEALVAARETDRLMPDDKKRIFGSRDLVLPLIETGQVDAALAEIEAWSARSPEQSQSQDVMRARALLARGDDAAALDLTNAVLSRGRIDIGAQAVRGIAQARLGNGLAAISDIDGALEGIGKDRTQASYEGLTPGFMSDLALHRGLARLQLRQVNFARVDFTEAIRLAPDRARPYAERARLALMAGSPAALTDIAMALRIEPAEPRWLALAARINLVTGDTAAAERLATEALAAKAADPDLMLLRAKARLALGKFGPALEDAAVRLAVTPSDAEALLVRIEARTGQGNLKDALADAEAARASNGGDARILIALAELKARNGDAPGAIGAFEEAVAKPDTALTANKRLGDLYAGIASDQLALGYYAKALELPAYKPEDETVKVAARAARDALIRKMAAPK
ncbi:tetratricopeptide repeat protein [Bosea sp. LjRoot9]|uniref:tetratricopeptide repeat protein n=1 Tax=Bosea sp. LjRoot9 TaxID=3342341 RepID=UPI003ECF1671